MNYLRDTSGQQVHAGDRVFVYSEVDNVTPVFGTLKLSTIPCFYKWSVVWDDLGELYWTELQPLWRANEPGTEDQSESTDIPIDATTSY